MSSGLFWGWGDIDRADGCESEMEGTLHRGVIMIAVVVLDIYNGFRLLGNFYLFAPMDVK